MNFTAYKSDFSKAVRRKTQGTFLMPNCVPRRLYQLTLCCALFHTVITKQHFTTKYGACIHGIYLFKRRLNKIDSFNKYLLSLYHVPDTVLGQIQWGKKPDVLPALTELTLATESTSSNLTA